MRLVWKECKAAACSVVYLVFVVALLAFYVSQYYVGVQYDIQLAEEESPRGRLVQPVPGLESYGTVHTEDPALVMPNATERLLGEYRQNSYVTYPFSFIRYVRLNEGEQAKIAAMLESVTGQSIEALAAGYDAFWEEGTAHLEGAVLESDAPQAAEYFTFVVGYDEFKAQLALVDGLLGGGSYYAVDDLSGFSPRPKTYEVALAEYNEFIYEDMVTRGYARLFCDYVGIAIALFSIFVPVSQLMRDSRAKAQQLVYSRRISSAKLMLARYLASLAAVFVPVLVLASVSMAQLIPYCAKLGLQVAPFAFYFYSFTWLLPTVMVCCGVGFFFTTLTGTPLGIAVQLVWSFLTITARDLTGDFKGAFLLRNNSVLQRGLIKENMNLLIRNRIGFACLGVVLLLCAVVFYELQRRGKLNVAGTLRKRFTGGKKTAVAAGAA